MDDPLAFIVSGCSFVEMVGWCHEYMLSVWFLSVCYQGLLHDALESVLSKVCYFLKTTTKNIWVLHKSF